MSAAYDRNAGESDYVRSARRKAEQALRMVMISMPWISGLAATATLRVDSRVSVAAVARTGRIYVNPYVFNSVPLRDAVYVIAHELMHLALDTFSRETSFDDPETVNRAHDYVINDLLRSELNMDPPLGGLNLQGAAEWSLEKIVGWMNENEWERCTPCWSWSGGGLSDHRPSDAPRGDLSAALRDAGLVKLPEGEGPLPVKSGKRAPSNPSLERIDVIFPSRERELFPDSHDSDATLVARIRREAVRALSLNEIARAINSDTPGGEGHHRLNISMLETYFRPPWEQVLQHWLEGSAPGPRTYFRPSRRGADRTDCVLPGRKREGWTMHIVLDTSGSMLDDLPGVLGSIQFFCENAGVSDIHIIQCGDVLTADEWVPVERLAELNLIGGGGGGLSPGFERLQQDPEVSAALIITDTYEEYPQDPPPFDVLWAVVRNDGFIPPYGAAVYMC
jgi:predicted metal-dependent peptidase